MIYRILVGFFWMVCFTPLNAQVLRDINYNYRYDPDGAFNFNWKVVRQGEVFKVFYELRPTGAFLNRENFTIHFETRESISEKDGNPIPFPDLDLGGSGQITGLLSFPVKSGKNIVVAKIAVSGSEKPQEFIFHKPLPKTNLPYMLAEGITILNSFININKGVTFSEFDPTKPLHIGYYKNSFPAASPVFSDTQAKVSKTIKPDSTFLGDSNASITFREKGLYLVQQDTAAIEGLAFRVEEDYPKLGKLETLAGPLLYICTMQETEKVKLAGNDKKKFDQVILSITGNADRARSFMRSYFKRVELANAYFSSYKEGWKTDRGMIYIVFGLPEEVYLFEGREVWEYKNDNAKIRFQFVQSPTIFDPDNYVLIRDKKFKDTWYDRVDLWRKGGF